MERAASRLSELLEGHTKHQEKNHRLERFSYDLEMKTRQQNRNNKRNRADTNARDFWLVKRTLGCKNFMPENFLEIN